MIILAINLDSKEDIDVEDKKIKRYRLPDGIEFFVIDDLIESETEGGISGRDIGAKGKRSTKRVTHALIVSDPKYPTMPYDVWREKMRLTVMGTLRTDAGIPHANIPHADSITVTASSAMQGGVACNECGNIIPFKESRCPKCGALSQTAG